MDQYFNDHPKTFAVIEVSIVTVTLPLFVATLVHALRGNKEKFVIIISSLLLLMYAVYYCYVFVYSRNFRNGIWGNVLYSLSIVMFECIHWGIAYTYFECSSTSPF